MYIAQTPYKTWAAGVDIRLVDTHFLLSEFRTRLVGRFVPIREPEQPTKKMVTNDM